MTSARASGILLHPTSLPGRFGIGDLGPEAFRWLDFLAGAGQKLWQVLPLGPTGYGDSPYQCFSAFAGNPNLVSPERLLEDGLLGAGRPRGRARLPGGPRGLRPGDRVEAGGAGAGARSLRRRRGPGAARRRTRRSAPPTPAGSRTSRCSWRSRTRTAAPPGPRGRRGSPARERGALDARHAARLERRGGPAPLPPVPVLPAVERGARPRARAGHPDHRRLPIFVAHDSADVWAHPDLFQLDAKGRPTVVAGVPPDYFSEDRPAVGQPALPLGGACGATATPGGSPGCAPRSGSMDLVRLDHFRGFEAYWEVPAGKPTAEHGRWAPGPAEHFFEVVRAALGDAADHRRGPRAHHARRWWRCATGSSCRA